jgi:urease accessory protein UreH
VRAAGSIALCCDAPGGRSRLRTIRCEGLARSSRAFAAPAGAIRVQLSTLGPGVLGGDRFTVEGSVAFAASLIAAGQMATPVFAGAGASRTDATWHVADGATLVVAGEPLLLEPGSTHAAGAHVAVSGSGTAIIVDTFGLRGPATLTMRTLATLDGTLVYRDAFALSGDEAGAVGTVTMIGADPAARAAFAAHANAVAAGRTGEVRIGTGETVAATVVRVTGARVWDVRAAAFSIARVSAP